MIFVRAMVIVLGTFVTLTAVAQTKLSAFVEANGCKLLAAEAAVKRLKEIAAQGSVTWDGNCKRGLIDGRGVLREEGTVIIGGKTKKYAYYLSGTAKNGVRSGRWRRETYDRFVDSSKFYTSAATIDFVRGIAQRRPKLIAVRHIDQFSPAFRELIIEARREAAPDNKALQQAVASTPAPSPAPSPLPPTPPSPSPSSPPPPSPPAPDAQQPAQVTASSQHQQYGPEGLLVSKQPGWHSRNPPKYPEWVVVDFQAPREVRRLGLLPQDGALTRAPKAIRVEISNDGLYWTPVTVAENTCAPNLLGGWSNIDLPKPVTARHLKIFIFTNCGDAQLLTFRGLRFE